MKSVRSTARIAAMLVVAVLLSQCDDEENAPPPAPVTITQITPSTAFEGEPVGITGTNFSATASQNVVKFNGTPASISTASPTHLDVTVPQGATTGKVTVQVGDQTATSSSVFTVKQTMLTGFSPEKGFTGATVTITGSDFIADPAANEVKFNGVAATVTEATASKLVATVPEGATTGKITVTTNGKTLTSATDFTVLELTITSFAPTEGTVGSHVVIEGANFSPESDGNVVKFGDAEAVIIEASSTEITVQVPPEAETGVLSVTTSGKTATTDATFTVLVPSIHDFSPLLGSPGMEITINGEYFSPQAEENKVTVGNWDIVAEVLSATETELVIRAPADAYHGTITVDVNGKIAVSTQSFKYQSAQVTTHFPDRAAPGIAVTFTGEYFSPFKEFNTITFGGVAAEIVSATATELVVVVPEGSTDNEVRIGNGWSTSGTYFEVCPVGTELFPFDPDIVAVAGDGESFTLRFKIINAGSESADLSKVTVIGRVSEDDISQSTDPDITDIPLSGTVASGETVEKTVNVELPPGITLEDHPYAWIGVHVTPGTLEECDITNNGMSITYE